MDLLLNLNEWLNETEQELKKYLNDKYGESTSKLPNVIPVISTAVPSTLGTTLAPNSPLVTAEVVTGIAEIAGTTQESTSILSTEELIESMEEMKLQVSELQKVKEQYYTLE